MEKLKITKKELMETSSKAGIELTKAETLWYYLLEKKTESGFSLLNSSYRLGAFIFLFALFTLMSTCESLMGDQGVLITSSIYSVFFLMMGVYLWKKSRHTQIGGLSVFLSVLMISLTSIFFQRIYLMNPEAAKDTFLSSRIFTTPFFPEIITLLAAFIALHFIRYPLITAVIYSGIFGLCLELISYLTKTEPGFYVNAMSIALGVGILVWGFILDRKQKTPDYAFWAYFMGLSMISSGLLFNHFETELGHAIYGVCNILFILLGALLKRTTFLVFGFGGLSIYLGSLMIRHYTDIFSTPLILGGIAISILLISKIAEKYKYYIKNFFEKFTLIKRP